MEYWKHPISFSVQNNGVSFQQKKGKIKEKKAIRQQKLIALSEILRGFSNELKIIFCTNYLSFHTLANHLCN